MLCNSERMPLFAVVRTQGAAWRPATGLEGQPEWREHADFMNALEAEGLVVLGGPLDGTPDVLLVMRADSAEAVRQRLDRDPWTSQDLLHVRSITPWSLRLGTLPAQTQNA
jgi:uncharacterized protein YciI